jgi:peptide-methionine (R)-S-oxide reductase
MITFGVARKAKTKPDFTAKYYTWKEKGIYRCARCRTDLFLSDTKFKSGTGWPFLWAPVSERNFELKKASPLE